MVLQFLLLLATFVLQAAHADSVVKTDYQFFINARTYQKFAATGKNIWNGRIREPVSNKVYENPYHTELQGIKAKTLYRMEIRPVSSQSRRYSVDINLRNLSLFVRSVETDDVIYKRIGNNKIKVPVTGSCRNLQAGYNKSSIDARAKVVVETYKGRLKFRLKKLRLGYDPAKWQTDVKNCNGPQGYGKVIQKFVHKTVRKKSKIKKWIKPYIKRKLSAMADKSEDIVLKNKTYEVAEDVSVHLRPKGINLGPQGQGTISGVIHIKMTGPGNPEAKSISFKETPLRSSERNQIVVPQKLPETILTQLYHTGLLEFQIKPQRYKALRAIFTNRMAQWMYWPDLLEFDPKTEFIFDIYTFTPPRLVSLNNQGKYLSGRLKGGGVNVVKYLRDYGPKPYVNFFSTYDIPFRIGVQGVNLIAEIRNLNMDSFYSFDQLYLKNNESDRWINTDFLEKKLEKMADKKWLRVKLGLINLGPSGLLYPVQLKKQQKTFRIFLSRVPANQFRERSRGPREKSKSKRDRRRPPR